MLKINYRLSCRFMIASLIVVFVASPAGAGEDGARALIQWLCGIGSYYCGIHSQTVLCCTRVIEQAPNWPPAYNLRGLAYTQKGEYTNAVRDFSTALRIAPQEEAFYYNRARAF